MSTVKITVRKYLHGFSDILVDGKFCGRLEDVGDGDDVANVMKKVINAIGVDNTEVIEVKGHV